jgi:hypothetical protein
MFRTSYVHHQEDYIIRVALYVFFHVFMEAVQHVERRARYTVEH